MKRSINTMMFYSILGLTIGVFYREFTKMMDYFEPTMLSNGHVHALSLGTFFFLVVLILDKLFDISSAKRYKGWYWLYNVSLMGVLATMITRGVLQVLMIENRMLSEVAGTFHMLYAAALVWFIIMLKKAVVKI